MLLGGHILGRVKDVNWNDREWGEMVVSRGEVCIQERRKTFQFGGQPSSGLRIPTVLIASSEIDSEHRMTINWIDQDDTSFEEIITFKKQGDAGVIAAALGRALKELGEESKLAQLERAERVRRQKEEQAQKEEFLTVQNERKLVWKTAGQLWEIVRELHLITLSLPGEDWKTIETSWRKIKSINDRIVLNLSIGVDSFMPALESRSADEGFKDTLNFIKLLGDSIKAIRIDRVEEEELAQRYESFPRWSHLPYFLLFVLTYTETMLCYKAGDNDTAMGNISRLGRLAIVLQEEFGMNLEESINLFAAGLETGDSGQVRATGQALEDYLVGAVEKRVGHD